MFGTNQQQRPANYSLGEYRVTEVFHTLQGEGPFAGEPAVFIRMQGCNLRCLFCDTQFDTGTTYTCDELMDKVASVRAGSTNLVVITGGEPLLQELGDLILALTEVGMIVQIETAGTTYPLTMASPQIVALYKTKQLVLVCSPKTGRVDQWVADWCNHWKYVIDSDPASCAEDDGLPQMSTQVPGVHQRLYRPPARDGLQIWVQPMELHEVQFGLDGETRRTIVISHQPDKQQSAAAVKQTAEVALRHGHRMTIQMHKMVGLP